MNTQNHTGPNPEFIKGLFNSISTNYDLANHVITLGLLTAWRKKFIKLSGAQEGNSVLDCATGTGDLALEFKKVVGDSGRVIGSDFSEGMLKLAPLKAKAQNLDIQFELGDVTQLQHEDNCFDITSIGYGIRNVVDPKLGLSEMARVTKSGGYVMVLETGENQNPVVRPFIKLYFNYVVPTLGAIANSNKGAYKYLNQSSGKFPCEADFVRLMETTGLFSKIKYYPLMGGASYIYKAQVK
ncbi:MAG: bifunctional demethylmenaquinone methyltransferase/2-methoxy-6-polyprenyl-1,4-benzoquinol methylase UbiE [Bdellovibrionaceae bacterium]|jgi:demethylmenaquinone methyltransferase / 2-methoxy-6-polyprenyl-1,4-benzoquinol methylase|nr:bifunctional demethylmenaquinone methyltransferase/2-methoxy-6-polyprenyl-1,4-benzoquinol methylase UbiE [Pseudobdellovibrionaceae bacterium]